MRKKQQKRWTQMTAHELAATTKEYDRSFRPPSVPPSPAELAKHKLAMDPPRRGRGRPALGDGAQRVLFTIDPALLARMDVFARKHGIKRSRLIAAGVEEYLRVHSGETPARNRAASSPFNPAA